MGIRMPSLKTFQLIIIYADQYAPSAHDAETTFLNPQGLGI